MKVLGLDLSLTSTGWACGGEAGTLTSKFNGVHRLEELADLLCDLAISLKPDIAAIEGYAFGSKNSQAHSIGEWGGVARLSLYSLAVPYVEIPPTCRAKFATGKGNASKGEVMSAISARTGLVWSGKGAEDQCDAWILEEMVLSYYGEPRFDWPALNLSSLEKVDWNPITRTSA